MPNTVDLAYGKATVSIELPHDANATLISKPPFPACPPASTIIADALARPIQSPTLAELAKNASSVCILICDITRPVPNGTFLKPMIDQLLGAGIKLTNITILVATGLHRPNEGEELRELLGDDWVFENVRVLNHFATNEEDQVDLGFTKTRKTPVKLNRHLVNADLKIATGLVEPHFMAGYSGGRKVIAPGVAHHETIRTFHSARFMEHPAATECILKDNPLHEEQLEIVRMLGDAYALNTVLDEHRNLVFASFGEIIASHLKAVEYTRDYTEIPIGRKFHTVLTSSAGYPLDQTYYQTVKGMVTPLDILEPGGTIIMVSECAEGFGSSHFREAQKKLINMGEDAFLHSLEQKQLASIDEWQTEKQVKPMKKGTVLLYSNGLSDDDHNDTGVKRITDVTKALSESMAKHGSNDIAVIPEGPYVIPLSRNKEVRLNS